MAYVELKPVKFDNFWGRNLFFSETGIKGDLVRKKNIVAIKNTSENFRIWSQPEIQKAMVKNRATFLIMSNRQLAYITFHILKCGFDLKNIKVYSSFQKRTVDSTEFIPDEYSSFKLSDLVSFFVDQVETSIAEVHLRKQNQEIIIKANGVIGFTNFSSQDKGNFLLSIYEAYNESQI